MVKANGEPSNEATRAGRAYRNPFQPGTRLDAIGQTLAAAYDHLLVAGVPDHLAELMPSAMSRDSGDPGARLAIVVEDDREVRALAEMILEETPLEVIGCDTAERALSVLHDRGGQVALMFVDVRLPGAMDGVQLANAVATLWPKTHLVVTSGLALDRLAPMPDQAVFMAKPWRPLDVLVEAERAADGALLAVI